MHRLVRGLTSILFGAISGPAYYSPGLKTTQDFLIPEHRVPCKIGFAADRWRRTRQARRLVRYWICFARHVVNRVAVNVRWNDIHVDLAQKV